MQPAIQQRLETELDTPNPDKEGQEIHDRLALFDRLFQIEGHTAPCALQTVFYGKWCSCVAGTEPEAKEPDAEVPLSDNGWAFFLSLTLACLAEVFSAEDGRTHASVAKRKKLRALMGDLVKVTRLFTPEGFEYDDMKAAENIYDAVNGMVRKAYP